MLKRRRFVFSALPSTTLKFQTILCSIEAGSEAQHLRGVQRKAWERGRRVLCQNALRMAHILQSWGVAQKIPSFSRKQFQWVSGGHAGASLRFARLSNKLCQKLSLAVQIELTVGDKRVR